MNLYYSSEALQYFITVLYTQAFSHKLHAHLFRSEGYETFAGRYEERFRKEMEYVDEFAKRMLEIGEIVRQEKSEEVPMITDPELYLKEDIRIMKEHLQFLRKCMRVIKEDKETYRLFHSYMKTEESELAWEEKQLKQNPI